jgi:hypothetical protein
MQRNEAVRKMEAQLLYKKSVLKEIDEEYEQNKTAITETISGLRNNSPENIKILEEYNKDYIDASAEWSDKEKEAVKSFTGTAYRNVNKYLRNPKKFIKELNPEYAERQMKHIKDTIEGLDSIFAKTSQNKERTLYRVLEQDTTEGIIVSSEKLAKKLNFIEGNVITFKSYSSTTIDAHLVNRLAGPKEEQNLNIVFIIKTRQGVPVDQTITNEKHGSFTEDFEREILLPRNTQYKVTKTTREIEYDSHDDYFEPINPLTVYLEEI